jgi:hypothetical protein
VVAGPATEVTGQAVTGSPPPVRRTVNPGEAGRTSTRRPLPPAPASEAGGRVRLRTDRVTEPGRSVIARAAVVVVGPGAGTLGAVVVATVVAAVIVGPPARPRLPVPPEQATSASSSAPPAATRDPTLGTLGAGVAERRRCRLVGPAGIEPATDGL